MPFISEDTSIISLDQRRLFLKRICTLKIALREYIQI